MSTRPLIGRLRGCVACACLCCCWLGGWGAYWDAPVAQAIYECAVFEVLGELSNDLCLPGLVDGSHLHVLQGCWTRWGSHTEMNHITLRSAHSARVKMHCSLGCEGCSSCEAQPSAGLDRKKKKASLKKPVHPQARVLAT